MGGGGDDKHASAPLSFEIWDVPLHPRKPLKWFHSNFVNISILKQRQVKSWYNVNIKCVCGYFDFILMCNYTYACLIWSSIALFLHKMALVPFSLSSTLGNHLFLWIHKEWLIDSAAIQDRLFTIYFTINTGTIIRGIYKLVETMAIS